MNNFTIYPDKELREQLDEVCKEENRSLNNFIITLLKKYFVDKNERREI